MEREQGQLEFKTKYFRVDEQYVYGQVECRVKEEQMEKEMERLYRMSQHNNRMGVGKKSLHLLLFIDKSMSMDGAYLRSLKAACAQIGEEKLFKEDFTGKKPFDSVQMVFYNNTLTRLDCQNNKDVWMSLLRTCHASGSTDFVKCFNELIATMDEAQDNSDYTIVFFTDGQDTANNQNLVQSSLKKLTNKMKREKKRVATRVLTIGLSENHEARLLNSLAQAGSEIGHFIYVDTRESDCLEQIQQAMQESMLMAVATDSVRLKLTSWNLDLAQEVSCHTIQEQAHREYFGSTILPADVLQSTDFQVQLLLTSRIVLTGTHSFLPAQQVDDARRMKARLMLINKKLFTLIQKIQIEEKNNTNYNAMLKIQEEVQMVFQLGMQVKDREERKAMLTELQQIQQRCNMVLTLIRDNGILHNETIAKLNNLAYKGIKKAGLQKMLDKRALRNQQDYAANEEECRNMVSNMDLEKLRKDNEATLEQVGTCVISTMDVVDAMADGDCMCIGLGVHRPEAAIADPARLEVQAVYPSYMTAQSFIQAAAFNITKKPKAHGGFSREGGELAMGQSRESIQGVMALYLFEEHWQVARKNVQPLYGQMFTLDVMGYSQEQYFTLPFLVYEFVLSRKASSSMGKQIRGQVQTTCQQVLLHHPTFTRNLVDKVMQFVQPPACQSTRTADVVKSLRVLLVQFYTLLQVKDQLSTETQLALSSLPDLSHAKARLVRYAAEEVLRRQINPLDTFVDKDDKLLAFLFKNYKKFIQQAFQDRKLEIEKTFEKSNKTYNFKKAGELLKEKLGYCSKKADMPEKEGDMSTPGTQPAKQQQKKENNFQTKVDEVTSLLPWLKNELYQTIYQFNDKFKKSQDKMIRVMNKLLKGDGVVEDLYSLPLVTGSHEEKQVVLMAILIQNGFHKQNSDRVGAIEKGHYRPIESLQGANEYFRDLLSQMLINKLRQKEGAFIKKCQGNSSKECAKEAITAPDHFQMAVIIKKNGFFQGRGDFSKAIQLLINKNDFYGYPDDLLNKIIVLKNMRIFSKAMLDECRLAGKGLRVYQDKLDGRQVVSLFCDKATNYGLRRQLLFALWAKYVFSLKVISPKELIWAFPEKERLITIWTNHCDSRGHVVKQHEEYNKKYNRKNFQKEKALKKAKKMKMM